MAFEPHFLICFNLVTVFYYEDLSRSHFSGKTLGNTETVTGRGCAAARTQRS
jgi:hypothetical protein